jgi:Skp family chaperone for outer membrane proteins
MKMDEYKRKKSRNYKGKRPSYKKPIINGGMLGGGNYRPRPPPFAPRRNYGYNTEQKHIPKQEKSHWNGKVEMWTEPQKPRQEKIVKYEVDTDKLLRELAKGNKDALNEIAEKLEREIKSEPTEETETQKKTDDAEKSTEEPEASEVSEETERKARKQTDESPDQAETDPQNENAEPQPENANDESQEMPQHIESETESSLQESLLDDPAFVYMNPSFWEQLESELSDELEQLEPEEDLEILPEEGEPVSEGY